MHQVVDVQDPDSKSLVERRSARLEQEEKEFNPEHYLADHFQTDCIDPLIDFKLPLPSADWTEAEANLLKNLPNKDFLLDPNLMQSTYLVLLCKKKTKKQNEKISCFYLKFSLHILEFG